jgi:hypothetical protein
VKNSDVAKEYKGGVLKPSNNPTAPSEMEDWEREMREAAGLF